MKKVVLLVLTLVLLLSGCIIIEDDISGSGSYEAGGETPTGDGQGSYEENRGDADEEDLAEKLEVAEYSYSYTASENYAFLVIKNNADKELYIEAEVRFYDENGTIVGAAENLVAPAAIGAETILDFECNERFAGFEYEIEASETVSESIVQDLTVEATQGEEKEIIAVTNNGSQNAYWVRADVLFFNGEELVGHGFTYFADDIALEPGDTATKEIECYEEYTSVKIYIQGEK